MGRKIEMKKIEHVTKCQVTFSKRRSSLINKGDELSTCCDVDVALIAFSPSGRVSQYCNRTRIEDVLNRYADLPAEKRLTQLENVEDKVDKLKQLSHIKGEASKLQFLDTQVKNLQLQIEKCDLESQMLEANMRDYEILDEEPAYLHHLSWCERNLDESRSKVIAKKSALASGSMFMSPHQPIQAAYSDAVQMATHFQAPRYGSSSREAANAYTLGMPQSSYNGMMGGYLQFPSSNCIQFNNSPADEIIGQSGINLANNLSNANAGNATLHIDGSFGMNCSQIQRNDQLQAPPYQFQPVNNTYPDTLYDNLPSQDAQGQNMPFQSGAQSNSWNWEDLLDINDNNVDYPPEH